MLGANRCFPVCHQTRTMLGVVGRSQTCHKRKAITPKNGRSGWFSQTHAIWLANYRVSWLLTGVTSRQRATWHSIFMGFLKGLPAFDRLVSKGAVRRHLASAGRAVPQLRQSVGHRPAQLPNRFVSEDRSRAPEPVDADIQDGQCLLELLQLGLKGQVFSCLDLPKSVARRPNFLRQVADFTPYASLPP